MQKQVNDNKNKTDEIFDKSTNFALDFNIAQINEELIELLV